MKNLGGKVAAVTGAGSGIGRALAVNLGKEGCHLALSDIDGKGLRETVQMVENKGVKVTSHVIDVADRNQVYRYADEVIKEHGRADIVINNAGVAVAETLEEVTYEDFEWVMNIDFWGAVYGTKAFLPFLKQQPEGHIVNISSINGMIPFPNNGPYNSAKFALRGFNKTLIQELRGTPVNITSVHPGGVKTNITKNMRFYKHCDQKLNHTELIDAFDKLARTTPDGAARIIISGIKKNKKRLLVGADARLMDFMSRMFPLLTTQVTGILTRYTLGR